MANAIVAVECAIESHAQSGHFSIPRAAIEALGLADDDTVHLDVRWGANAISLTTSMRSGTEVYPRQDDPGSATLAAIPAKTWIHVRVSRP